MDSTTNAATPGRAREVGAPFPIVAEGRAACDVLLLPPADHVVGNAAQFLADYTSGQYRTPLAVTRAKALPQTGRHIVALVGTEADAVRALQEGGEFTPDPGVRPQGFVIQRLRHVDADLLVCWGAEALGCRYGLIEILRSIDDGPAGCDVKLERCVDWPQFPMRIQYFNFAELLVNGYGVNMIHDSEVYRWSEAEWRRYIDMLSAMRFNVFGFWLSPRLCAPECVNGGGIYDRFADEMNAIIDYAHAQGMLVEMLVTVNNLGPDWTLHCPRVPAEREMLLDVWDHWTRRVRADIMGLFPGDPGGCTRNGCDGEDGIDLYLAIANRVKDNGPFEFEIATWGTPIWGWGEHGWKGDRARAERVMAHLIKRLPEFPPESFVSVNMGLNPAGIGDELGGDTRGWVEQISETHRVTTWDYCITEGEGAPHPHYKVPQILERRKLEAKRPYSGGITYTMCPQITQVQLFASAEAFWNTDQTPAAVEQRWARLAFGESAESLAGIFRHFDLMGDWAGGCERTREQLIADMAQAIQTIDRAQLSRVPRLPMFPSAQEYLASYRYFAELFLALARTHLAMQEAESLTRSLDKLGDGKVALTDAKRALERAPAGADRDRLAALVAQIEAADLPTRWQRHWDKICKVYDSTPQPKSYLAPKWMRDTFAPFGYAFVAGDSSRA